MIRVRETYSLELLDKSNRGVQKKQSADDSEIDPILETGGKNSGSFL